MNLPALLFPASPDAPPAAARTVLRLLERLGPHGTLSLRLPDGRSLRFGSGEPHASMSVGDWEVFGEVLARGDIALGEAYVAGRWSSPAPAEALLVLLRNREVVDSAIYGSALGRVFARARHLLNRNSRAGSRRNIEAHYDLGNDFYRIWLDDTMNYSSALFAGPEQDLQEAQRAKMRRALTAAGVEPGARLLEIGCGWGAIAEMAAGEYGAHVTGVTLSREQLAWGRERLARAGLAERGDLRLQDYRDIGDAPFDAICSIEMVEAVGRDYWPQYFATVARLLKPGGRACIQTIVIDDALWGRYIRGTDFIQQFVFPGGCLPCPREFESAARAAGLEVVESFAFGPDYARTLREWRDRFTARRAQVRALGFDERFLRLWEFYLCYCEAAFTQGNTDVLQYTLRKPLP